MNNFFNIDLNTTKSQLIVCASIAVVGAAMGAAYASDQGNDFNTISGIGLGALTGFLSGTLICVFAYMRDYKILYDAQYAEQRYAEKYNSGATPGLTFVAHFKYRDHIILQLQLARRECNLIPILNKIILKALQKIDITLTDEILTSKYIYA